MSSISSLARAVSAMMSNQSALNTTAHNLSNVNTTGYVRQQVLMHDASYDKVGLNETTDFQVGLGVDVTAIRQVRDQFLDISYRQENSRRGFYASQSSGIEEIEIVLGETEGESFAEVLNDLWVSMNELSKKPDGLETRGTFIQSAVQFVDRASLISDQLSAYQEHLNTEVISMVDTINNIGDDIYRLNEVIVGQEVGGGNANDYRDQRNQLLDQLSGMVDIRYTEDAVGNIKVSVEGTEFVSIVGVNHMDLAASEPFSTLVSPVWPQLGDYPVFDLSKAMNPENNNDKGSLKGLIITRGVRQADYRDMTDTAYYEANVKPSIIMNAQAQFDQLINGIVTTINDILSPNTVGPPPMLDVANAPYGMDGLQGTELFVRKTVDRYTAGVYNEPDMTNPYTLYTAGNIEVNSDLLSNYDMLPLSYIDGEYGDNSVVEEMLAAWEAPFQSIEPGLSEQLNFNEYYERFVSEVGNNGYAINNTLDNQTMMIQQIDNQRSQLTGVSSDEELGNMIKFQHAYTAAAKVVNVVDEMIEQIVMNTGLVGR